MERTKKIFKQASAILTGDWHLREDTPTCRTDDFQAVQWKKVQFISYLQKNHDCPVLHSGDLFNHWKPSPWLLSMAMQYLPNRFFTIFGNHDLPQHSLELANKCGIYALEKANKLDIYDGCHWGQIPSKNSWWYQDRDILVWHVMNYQGKEPWPGCTDMKAGGILRKYKDYDLILTGHNHIPFVEEYQGRVLVNPGCITRQSADQVDFRPRVYLWFADTNTVELVYLPIEEDVVTRDHLDGKAERDNKIDAFISRLNDDFVGTLSFEENLETFKKENQIREKTMEIIYKALEV